jgi:signal transduction histidine kinase
VGFTPDDTPPGAGLTNMADRLAVVGGTLVIDSTPNHGTRITARIPARHNGMHRVGGGARTTTD